MISRSYRYGVFCACVDDGLKEAVELVHVQLSIHQQLLRLLLHRQRDRSRHLLLKTQSR